MSNKKDVQKQFGDHAKAYVTSSIHSLGRDLKKLIEMAAPTKEDKVLDVATGGGHTANAFAPLVANVTALDLTSAMLENASVFIKGNGHENVVYVEGDAEKLPFKNETFDVVVCRIAPHHFSDVHSFIRESFRTLKSGGRFLIDDNTAPEKDEWDHFYNTIEKARDYSHFRAWKKSEWIKMLEENGFIVSECHRFEKAFEFSSWCDRMKLSTEKEDALNQYMISASASVKEIFQIQERDGRVISFQGEAFLIKAIKR